MASNNIQPGVQYIQQPQQQIHINRPILAQPMMQQQPQATPSITQILKSNNYQSPQPITVQPPPPPTQPVPYKKISPTPEVIPPPRPQLSIFDELSNTIKLCNSSNPVHKSNVRYLLDNVQRALSGSKLK
jgi:hypothetical protein